MQNWEEFFANPQIGLERRRILHPTSRVFTMGSCFALEVRKALKKAGLSVYPDYDTVQYDDASQMFDKRGREMPPHYDTFTMRQEFEAMLGKWPDRSLGYYPVTGRKINELLQSPTVYQDPYRKMTYAVSEPLLEQMSSNITEVMAAGLKTSDVIVLTLGLTEAWQHIKTGKYFVRPPNSGYGGGKGLAEFVQSTFLQNYENMRAIIDMLFAQYPEKNVVISVSPVRLQTTYSQSDIGTANLESKSILRAVAGQICREYGDKVTYFPSYEFAMLGLGSITGTGQVFEADGRHVQPPFVNAITAFFQKAFAA